MPANHKTTNPSKMIQLQRVPFLESGEIPTWTNIMKDSTTWKVSFDMVDDLPNAHRSAFNIGHDKTRLVRLYKNKWYKSDRNNSFHLFGVYSNSNTNKVSLRKMAVLFCTPATSRHRKLSFLSNGGNDRHSVSTGV